MYHFLKVEFLTFIAVQGGFLQPMRIESELYILRAQVAWSTCRSDRIDLYSGLETYLFIYRIIFTGYKHFN